MMKRRPPPSRTFASASASRSTAVASIRRTISTVSSRNVRLNDIADIVYSIVSRARFAGMLIVIAAAARSLSLGWLHPLNWDELEFFRATDWVRQDLVPYRDFWEHHTPLQWFVFAPFAAMTSTPGAAAIVWMRIAQIPLWIATFWLANLWMKRNGIGDVARWTAMALACCSSLFMLAAVEYRVDVLGCTMVLAALVILSGEDGEGSGRLVLGGVF